MNINTWVKEIYVNAKEHGWHDEPRSFGDIVALCHSELSEALEEYRANKGNLYYNGEKPEGINIELIDCVIRIFDYLGSKGVNVEELMKIKHEYNKTRTYRHGNKKI